MKRIVLKFILFVLFSILLESCTKENAKNKYIFHLEFDSGDVWEKECYLYEKYKRNNRYKESEVDKIVDLKHSKDVIYTDALKGKTVLYKVDNHILTGISDVSIIVSNFNIINNQSGLIQGDIELLGEYKQKHNAYLIENGTFKFKLWGALYNLPDTTYTGTWTLRRK